MHRTFLFLVALTLTAPSWAQTPQSRLTYEERSGTTGHTIVVDGKTFGPYKEVTSITYSTTGSSGVFLVTKREKTYIVAQGKEWGPLGAGFDLDRSWISDDGKVWAVTANKSTEAEDEDSYETTETQLWVNGKLYGPFTSVGDVDYSELGGHWLATVQRGEEEYDVLFDGKPQGPFKSVDHTWVFPDGKGWGWATTNSNDETNVVTQDRTYKAVQSTSFGQMYPRNSHWAYGIKVGEDQEEIVVDGKAFTGYLNFSGLFVSPSGKHWSFGAEKLSDAGDYPVVVVDGKEFVGEGLNSSNLGSQEFFTWSVKDGNKVTIQVMTLP